MHSLHVTYPKFFGVIPRTPVGSLSLNVEQKSGAHGFNALATMMMSPRFANCSFSFCLFLSYARHVEYGSLMYNITTIYRLGQIKRGQLSFLLVTIECIYKIL